MIKEIVFFNFTYVYNCTLDQDIFRYFYFYIKLIFRLFFICSELCKLLYIFLYIFLFKKTIENYFFLIFIIHRKTNSLK